MVSLITVGKNSDQLHVDILNLYCERKIWYFQRQHLPLQ
jgi:hypothetical protein